MNEPLVVILKDLVNTNKDVAQDRERKVQVIIRSLQSKKVVAQMEFLISVKPLFDQFMVGFQKEEPMIHKLYPACEKLLKVALSRTLKSKVYNIVQGRNLL